MGQLEESVRSNGETKSRKESKKEMKKMTMVAAGAWSVAAAEQSSSRKSGTKSL